MSIFGKMDTDKISDDPWAIEDGWYKVTVTKSFESEVDGQDYVNFRYTIDMPDSKYHGKPANERFEVYPWAGENGKELSGEQDTNVSRLMRRLTKGFGLSRQDVADFGQDVALAVGTDLYIKIRNNKGTGQHEGKTFMNIVDASSVDEYESKSDQISEVAKF